MFAYDFEAIVILLILIEVKSSGMLALPGY